MIGRLVARLRGRHERPALDSREVVQLRAHLSADGRISTVVGVNAAEAVVWAVAILRAE